ncbi:MULTISPECIES: hypothetical protein [Micrococcales]|jgi:hypothetical protein|nr:MULTISPECIES: hypothetical protein [Micrococcales]MCT1366112.1 hypothetical protein [Microbacterium sp. p3-SID131]MCT1378259.1 hypothetical protein [Microbacterium sp. p3-SID337]
MAAKRTERRTSALSGQTPVNTQAVPAAQPTPAPAAVAPAAPAPTPTKAGGVAAKKPTRTKMNYYADSDQDGRIRAAFYAGRDKYRWRNMTDMQLHGVMGLVESLEREFNDGEHFEPMPPGTGPVGRPLE